VYAAILVSVLVGFDAVESDANVTQMCTAYGRVESVAVCLISTRLLGRAVVHTIALRVADVGSADAAAVWAREVIDTCAVLTVQLVGMVVRAVRPAITPVVAVYLRSVPTHHEHLWTTVRFIRTILAILGTVTHKARSDTFPVVTFEFQVPALSVSALVLI
jgi:uncharacterized membrane protein